MSTTKETKHSPLPWSRFDPDSLEILSADSHEVCNVFQCGGIREIDEADANAELIITAVNTHATNVELTRELTQALEWLIEQVDLNLATIKDADDGEGVVIEVPLGWLRQVEKILDDAKGDSQ